MNKLYKRLTIICLTIISLNQSHAIPPTFDMMIRNVTRQPHPSNGSDSILQFDVYMLWSNSNESDLFEYGSNQLNITFNPLIAAGGTLAASRVTALPPGGLPTLLQTTAVQVILNPDGSGTYLFQGSSIVPNGANNFFINPVFPGTCLGRFKIRTTAHQLTCVTPDLKFQLKAPNNTFPLYMKPSTDPDDPDNQVAMALYDTIANHYLLPNNDSVCLNTPSIYFQASQTNIFEGDTINFTESSSNAPTMWAWSFPGGTPSSSTLQNPTGIVYSTPGSYSVTLACTNSYGTRSLTKTNYIVVTPVKKYLNLTAFIQGFYDSFSNLMTEDIVSVCLRQGIAPYSLVDSVKGMLDSLGKRSFTFTNASNNSSYYLIVKHRNTIETWSSGGQLFINDTLNYNFTTAISQAYGSNMKQVDTSPVRYACYNGDVNLDGIVNLSDILTVYLKTFTFVSGYDVTDVTGDNVTNLMDLILTFNNAEEFVTRVTP